MCFKDGINIKTMRTVRDLWLNQLWVAHAKRQNGSHLTSVRDTVGIHLKELRDSGRTMQKQKYDWK